MTRGKSRTDQGLNTDLTMKKDNIQEIMEDKELVPDRLIARIQKWEEIGGASRVLMGAQPSWISKTLLEELEARHFHPKFRGSTQQHMEYANQLQQEL
ncbi:MAG: hypothetical protein EZS28_030965, partial [Streblomastix strix]